MDQHDRDLLEKQFRAFHRRDDGVAIWTAFTILFAGLAVGGLFYAYEAGPRVASNNAVTITALLNGSQPDPSQLQ